MKNALLAMVLAAGAVHGMAADRLVGASPTSQTAARATSPGHVEPVATRLVEAAMAVVEEHRGPLAARDATEGLSPSRAALIGVEVSPLMTTLGSLESKRLATDPRWAALIARQLHDRGVRDGVTVAASFSGSFPGLNLAVMAACRALGARLVAISSVTASTWGADEPGFTWPEIEVMVSRRGVLPAASIAISVGGTRDAGRDLTEEGLRIAREIQHRTAEALGAAELRGATLEDSIALRIGAYRAAMAGQRPGVYVNVGGNHASLGGARATLRHAEGWLEPRAHTAIATVSPVSVTEFWLGEGVPVMNLLDVKALAARWRLGQHRGGD